MKFAVIVAACVVLVAASAPAVAARRELLTSVGSVADLAASEGFTSLQAALNVSNLLGDLSNSDTTNTVFAPNDAAFDAFLKTQNWQLIDLLKSDYLQYIMKYHLLNYVLKVGDMKDGQEVFTNFAGQNLNLTKPSSSDSKFTVKAALSTAGIVQADISAGKSIVHVVNAVLVPKVDALEQAAFGKILTSS